MAEANSNNQFNELLATVKHLDETIKKITKDAKKTRDSLICLNRIECKITEDLTDSQFIFYFPTSKEFLQDWHTLNQRLTEIGDKYAISLEKMVIDPMHKLEFIVREVKDALKKRNKLSETLFSLEVKAQQLAKKERTGNNICATEENRQKIEATKKKLKSEDEFLYKEIPEIIESRLSYFTPSLLGIIKSQTLFWGDSYKELQSQSLLKIDESPSSNSTSYFVKQINLLKELSSLSIVEGG